jgi:5-carboxymethyl-2-hydroxymuconate isomerase
LGAGRYHANRRNIGASAFAIIAEHLSALDSALNRFQMARNDATSAKIRATEASVEK